MTEKNINIPKEQIDHQKDIMYNIRERFIRSGAPPLFYMATFGCQQNEADSERLGGMLCTMGYTEASDPKDADIVVINTCAVREHAEMRALGNIGALIHSKSSKPGQLITLCGCMVKQPGMLEKIKKSYRHVDLAFDPQSIWRFPELLLTALDSQKKVFDLSGEDTIFEGLPVKRGDGAKAWLPIMYGCNNFCSYCVVPYVRGRERSRAPEAVLSDARGLIGDGYRDITLLGQNVNSYGSSGQDMDFTGLLREICALDGDFLVRFMTSHPKDAGERLFETMALYPKAARHLHLPFQSGSDRILREMNRRYSSADYLELVRLAREYMPDITLTSDVIVGFPGETEDEFEDTLELIKAVRFDALFTFIYSKREGTKAAQLPDPFTKDQKSERFNRLLEVQNAISNERHSALVGQTLRVLIDGEGKDGRYMLTGRTNGGRLVCLNGDKSSIGSFMDVKITANTSWSLYGELV